MLISDKYHYSTALNSFFILDTAPQQAPAAQPPTFHSVADREYQNKVDSFLNKMMQG